MKIVDYLEHILIPDTSYSIPDKFTLSSIFGTSPWPYYNYQGSLTTPPCTENVVWIVSRKKFAITSADVIWNLFIFFFCVEFNFIFVLVEKISKRSGINWINDW